MAERYERGIELELIACAPDHNTNRMLRLCMPMMTRASEYLADVNLQLRLYDDFITNTKDIIVNIMTILSITRCNERNLSAEAITKLLKCLPRVQQLHYEPWNTDQHHDVHLAHLLKD